MKRNGNGKLTVWDLKWTHGDDPEADHSEVGVTKEQVRLYFQRSPRARRYAQLIRAMEAGDDFTYVSENVLTRLAAKCYEI